MSFWDTLKQHAGAQFLDVIQWLDDTNNTLVYRFPVFNQAITDNSKLVVREGQAAVFVAEGQLSDVFGPGTYTLDTRNTPIMGFFKSIPRDLEDAAMVDGLSRFSAFLRVVVPVSFSGLVTVSIFAFTLVLQEFVYALTFLSSVSKQTVGVGVPIFLIRGDVFYWGELMAACLVACIPVAIVYNIFLDRLIQGFTVGAVK